MLRSLGRSLWLILLLATNLHAECMVGVFPLPPCELFWKAAAVFVGTVTEITHSPRLDKRQTQDRVLLRHRITHFNVGRAFRGISAKQLEIVAIEPAPPLVMPDGRIRGMISDSDCGYHFKEGESYLVYAFRNPNEGYLQASDETRLTSEATEDLTYIQGLSTAPHGSTIHGKIRGIDQGLNNTGARQPVVGAKINVRGMGRTIDTDTDSDGNFQVTGLLPGSYTVTPTISKPFAPISQARTVSVADRGCAQVDFITEHDGHISGTVLDADGEPARKLQIELILAESANSSNNTQAFNASTGDDGHYEFQYIPPGEYLLGVGLSILTSPMIPYHRTFYPGVPDPTQATVIYLREGEDLHNYDLTLPPRLAKRKIEGVVVWPDGHPAPNAYVDLMMNGIPTNLEGNYVSADEQGRFSLTGFDDTHYRIEAHVDLPPPARQLYAGPIDVPANGDTTDIRIVVNSPGPNPRQAPK